MKLRDRLGKILLGLARRVAPSLFSTSHGSANLGVRCHDRWHHGFTQPKGVVVDFCDTGEIVVLVESHDGKTHIWEERLESADRKLRICLRALDLLRRDSKSPDFVKVYCELIEREVDSSGGGGAERWEDVLPATGATDNDQAHERHERKRRLKS